LRNGWWWRKKSHESNVLRVIIPKLAPKSSPANHCRKPAPPTHAAAIR
jgi:hypothetical protein